MPNKIIFIPHGGGPLPLLNEPSHKVLIDFLLGLSQIIDKPKAILIISAHWEEQTPTISSAAYPRMIYDYGGFPAESYLIQYPAPGSPSLARQIQTLLLESGIRADLDEQRGYDHGTFVPLKLIYPNADIPVVQLSLLKNLNADAHLAMGKAIASLSHDNVLIVGSGSSFHNLSLMRQSHPETAMRAKAFDDWLNEKLLNKNCHYKELEQLFKAWQEAPYARFCHPREEHLLPLHVCLGAALANNFTAHSLFNENVMNIPMSGFIWSE